MTARLTKDGIRRVTHYRITASVITKSTTSATIHDTIDSFQTWVSDITIV